MLRCNLEVSEFEHQSRYHVQFRTNTLRKGMDYLIHLSYGLYSITAVLLQGWH